MKKIPDLEKKRRDTSSTVETQNAPTPRPWETYACHVYAAGDEGGNVCSMSDPRAKTILGYSEVRCGSEGVHEAYANAELICRAVNSFDDLLSVTKEAREHLVRSRTTHLSASPEARHAFVERMEAAITKAEARSVPSAPEKHLAAPGNP